MRLAASRSKSSLRTGGRGKDAYKSVFNALKVLYGSQVSYILLAGCKYDRNECIIVITGCCKLLRR
jgi:hypothetical protein